MTSADPYSRHVLSKNNSKLQCTLFSIAFHHPYPIHHHHLKIEPYSHTSTVASIHQPALRKMFDVMVTVKGGSRPRCIEEAPEPGIPTIQPLTVIGGCSFAPSKAILLWMQWLSLSARGRLLMTTVYTPEGWTDLVNAVPLTTGRRSAPCRSHIPNQVMHSTLPWNIEECRALKITRVVLKRTCRIDKNAECCD